MEDLSQRNRKGSNRIGVNTKSQVYSYRTNGFPHQSPLTRINDKNRIDNLGHKLESLREQIKKEIMGAH